VTDPAWRVEINGRPASPDAQHVATWGNYGHFTAMQVRGRRTRGLDLHLARLDAANRELFDRGLAGDLVRDRIRHALDDIQDASVRVWGYEDGVLVIVQPPVEMPARPQALRTVRYQRPVAHIKHSGGFAQGYHLRRVQADGFDEALLTDADGTISEGAITNVGCWDGSTVIWPDAPALAGITMQLLWRGLAHLGVPQEHRAVRVSDLPSSRGVFITNSHGIAPVDRVDDLRVPVEDKVMTALATAYQEVPWDAI
jgi:branched-subunit amino acid aminotransferase/4-amino-4-deoxychorismate lyase